MSDRTVIVADDNRSLRVLVRTMLTRECSWTVLEAEDGDSALALADPGPVHLFILDERMPGKSGTEVAAELRGRGYSGPIVLFSAYLDLQVEQEAARLRLIPVAKSDIGHLTSVASDALTNCA